MVLWLSTRKKRTSQMAERGERSRQREQHEQKQETAGSVRETAPNSIWPKQEGLKRKG